MSADRAWCFLVHRWYARADYVYTDDRWLYRCAICGELWDRP